MTHLILRSLLVCFFLSLSVPALSDNLKFEGPLVAASAKDSLEGKKILLSMPGMGTAFSWNFGSLHAMYEALEPVRRNQVVLSGNSGGAVPALYFSCRGFSPESLRDAERLVVRFPAEIANEDKYGKLIRLFLRIATEFPDKRLMEHIEEVIPNECRPNLPFIVPVGNSEVIERRLELWPHAPSLNPFVLVPILKKQREPRPLVGTRDLRHRRFDPITYWVNDVSGEQPKHIGKACTYLVSPSMFRFLKEIPEEERLCDLRLIEDAEDMRFAMRLAVGETTYYDPLGEDPSYFNKKRVTQASLIAEGKLIVSSAELNLDPSFTRLYNGGMMMPGAANRDFVAHHPNIQVLSTGRPYFYDPTLTQAFDVYSGTKGLIDLFSSAHSSYLKPKKNADGTPKLDARGNQVWGLPPDGEALFMRSWFGIDINQLVYYDQSLTDLSVHVDPKMVSANSPKGKARNTVLSKEIREGYMATWRCFEPGGAEACSPPTRASVPSITPQDPSGKEYQTNPVPIPPIQDLALRPEGWKPRLNTPVKRTSVAFPDELKL